LGRRLPVRVERVEEYEEVQGTTERIIDDLEVEGRPFGDYLINGENGGVEGREGRRRGGAGE